MTCTPSKRWCWAVLFTAGVSAALHAETLGSLDVEPRGGASIQHDAATSDRILLLDGSEGTYAGVKPQDAWHTSPNFRAEVRLRLEKYRGGSVPLGWPGRFWFYVNGEGKPWALLETENGRVTLTGDDPLPLGTWVHLALEYRAKDFCLLYVNGKSVAAATGRGLLPPGGGELWFGRYQYFENNASHDIWLKGAVAAPRFTPLADDDRYALDTENLCNAMRVSWGDAIVMYNGWRTLTRPEHAAPFVEECQRMGIRKVFLRCSSEFILDYCERPAMNESHRYTKAINSVEGDPKDSIVEECHKAGIKVYAYNTIFDEGSPPSVLYGGKTPYPWQSRFTIEHPEYLVESRDGTARQWGVLCYAYPEARAYTVSVFKDLVSRHAFDGVYICTRTHSRPAEFADQFGYNEPIAEEFKRRYGVDIRTQPFSKSRWWDLQGEYLSQLLREMREALPDKEIVMAIPRADHIGAPYGNMTLDWRTWLEEELIDALVVSAYSGTFLYPEDNGRPGYVQSEQDGIGIRPLQYDLEEWFGPACKEHGVELYLRRNSVITDKDQELLAYPGMRGFMTEF